MSTFLQSALICGKAAASIEPFTGAAIKAWEDFQDAAEKRRRAEKDEATATLLKAFAERVAEIEDRLDGDVAQTEEFSDLFKNALRLAEQTHRSEKLKAAANALANGLLNEGDDEKLPFDELDHFVRCLDRLALQAIRLLAEVQQLCHIKPPDLPPEDVRLRTMGLHHLYKRLPGIDRDLIDAQLEELTQAGFVKVVREAPRPRPPIQMGKRPNEQGVYPSDPPRPRNDFTMTKLGWRFRTYVLRDAADA